MNAEVVRREVSKLADEGKSVLLIGHSYGGWLATQSANPELERQIRVQRGEEGGALGIFFISGHVLPNGQSIGSFLFAVG